MVTKQVWLPSFEIGSARIDGEHRHLFELAQRIYEASTGGHAAACCGLAGDFVVALKRHFAEEEAFLRHIGYPDLDEHIELHTSLVAHALKLSAICCSTAGHGANLEECYKETVTILVDEFLRGDLKFKSYLQFHHFPSGG